MEIRGQLTRIIKGERRYEVTIHVGDTDYNLWTEAILVMMLLDIMKRGDKVAAEINGINNELEVIWTTR